MFTLGQKARDKVTGFEGIITGHARHLTGCDTYGLCPPAKDGKVNDSFWFDESRIEIIGPGVVLTPPQPALTGGPQDTPGRSATSNPTKG